MTKVLKYIAGVDIGNSTTECCIASKDESGKLRFLSSSITSTTGIKGTTANIEGIITALNLALTKCGLNLSDLDVIRLNEATPVIGDMAMETISETVIVNSAMIGHNPSTPSGVGLAVGITINLSDILKASKENKYIVIVPKNYDFDIAANKINYALSQDLDITGAIVQNDDAVLINNRLKKTIPIVDEVIHIEKVPVDKLAAIEVAPQGETVKVISNPYGLATVFNLSPIDTKNSISIAKSLIGSRSGVVIKTPEGSVKLNKIPAGKLRFISDTSSSVDVLDGAEEIMKVRNSKNIELDDVEGENGTNTGSMIFRVKDTMAKVTSQSLESMRIKDLLAVDTFSAVNVLGGIAGEKVMENSVMLAAMVKTSKLPMEKIADILSSETGVFVKIAGTEAVMALKGALTTPGTEKPLVILDIGGGSTDAAAIDKNNSIRMIHLAGAGDMVTNIINSELALGDKDLAEIIKRCPLAKVETLLSIKYEDSSVKFFEKPLNPELFKRVVAVDGEKLMPIKTTKSFDIENIRHVRRDAKKKVFITNAVRALEHVALDKNIRNIGYVVLVGGSALDFEIPEMLTEFLSQYRIVAGRGNIRGSEGPRNAVATGLTLYE